MSASTKFSWKAGPQSVQVAGSWDSFAGRKDLSKKANGSFETTLDLPATTKFTYKYIVDGSWQTSPLEPTEDDGQGNVNSFLTTTKADAAPPLSPAPFDNSVPNTPLPKTDSSDPKAPQAGAADLTKQSSLGGVAAAAAGGIAGASAGAAGIAAAFVGAATGEKSDKATSEQQATADGVVKQVKTGTASAKEQGDRAAQSTSQGAQGVLAAASASVADALGTVVGQDVLRGNPQSVPPTPGPEAAPKGLEAAGAGAPAPISSLGKAPTTAELSSLAQSEGKNPADAGAAAIAAQVFNTTDAVPAGASTTSAQPAHAPLGTTKGVSRTDREPALATGNTGIAAAAPNAGAASSAQGSSGSTVAESKAIPNGSAASKTGAVTASATTSGQATPQSVPAAPATPKKGGNADASSTGTPASAKKGSRFSTIGRRKSAVPSEAAAAGNGIGATGTEAVPPLPTSTSTGSNLNVASNPTSSNPNTPERKRKQSIFGKLKSALSSPSSGKSAHAQPDSTA